MTKIDWILYGVEGADGPEIRFFHGTDGPKKGKAYAELHGAKYIEYKVQVLEHKVLVDYSE